MSYYPQIAQYFIAAYTFKESEKADRIWSNFFWTTLKIFLLTYSLVLPYLISRSLFKIALNLWFPKYIKKILKKNICYFSVSSGFSDLS